MAIMEIKRTITACGTGDSPASQRRMVRSSRYKTSTAKRRADRPDASIALASSWASDSKVNPARLTTTLFAGDFPSHRDGFCGNLWRDGLNGLPRQVPSRHAGSNAQVRPAVRCAVVGQVDHLVADLHISCPPKATFLRVPVRASVGRLAVKSCEYWHQLTTSPVFRTSDLQPWPLQTALSVQPFGTPFQGDFPPQQYRAIALTRQGIVTNRSGAEG